MNNRMEQRPLSQASDDQIRAHAELLQLDTSAATNRDQLLSLLGPAWPHDYILVQEGDTLNPQQDAGATPPVMRLQGGSGKDDPKVILTIGKTDSPGGKDPVPLGHNGRTVIAQRDVRMEMPYRYFLVLMNAKKAEVTQNLKTGEIREDFTTNYPFNVHVMPSAEEIAAWHERVDNELMPA